MSIVRAMWKTVLNNSYVIIGLFVGIIISGSLNRLTCEEFLELQKIQSENNVVSNNNGKVIVSNNPSNQLFSEEKLLPNVAKNSETKKTEKRVFRPRYYSTELGIKDKLLVGVVTSEERLNTQAVYVNQTIGHVVGPLKFFMSVHSKPKSLYNLTNVVAFTDTRQKYKSFQILKYFNDNFINEYDYFFISNDFNFLNARRLKAVVNKISVGEDVYMGVPAVDSGYCDLDAGVLLSNFVVAAARKNLDWCLKNAISKDESENFGRCIHYSSGLECQEKVQDQRLNVYKMKRFGLEKHLEELGRLEKFNEAVSVYPVFNEKEFYLLDAYFSRLILEDVTAKIERLSVELNDSWPPGENLPVNPATRFDVPPQHYFNSTHIFFPDDFTNIQTLKEIDSQDIQKILKSTVEKVTTENGARFSYVKLVNGYRTFDWSRGMDYVIDLNFTDSETKKSVIKRFEICKPLGKVEFLSVPYVTESSRVTILLPVEKSQVEVARKFVNNFEKSFVENKEKVQLLLIFLYDGKSEKDPFVSIKNEVTKLTIKYKNDDNKIMWLSIKSESSLSSRNRKIVDFAMVDLSLKKVGSDSLILVLDVYAEPGVTFINRVRMNTIVNNQIFSPIPFRQYDPKISNINAVEINKNVGHFDREEYNYVSFYAKDYINMRLKSQHEVPIVRTDGDLRKLLENDEVTGDVDIFSMFVKYSKGLHAMRATEIALVVKNHQESSRNNLFIGSKSQLAKLILNNEDKIGITI